MPKYEVEVTLRGTYKVEAEDEDAAGDAAVALAHEDPAQLDEETCVELCDSEDEEKPDGEI